MTTLKMICSAKILRHLRLALVLFSVGISQSVFAQIQSLTIVSAASYVAGPVAPESIVAGFGLGLATTTEAATTMPLPTTLGGISLTVTDNKGVARLAPLFYVSPSQINFLIPAGTAAGQASVKFPNSFFSGGPVEIAPVAPALFAANANGRGVASGTALLVRGTTQSRVSIGELHPLLKRYLPRPLPPVAFGESLFLELAATGVRGNTDLKKIKAFIGGEEAEVTYAGPVQGFVGLDQINVRVPTSVAETGQLKITIIADNSVVSNQVEMEAAPFVFTGSTTSKIASFSPTTVMAGETLTIRGADFGGFDHGMLSAQIKVRISGIEAPILSFSATEIKVKVPIGAEAGPIIFFNANNFRASSAELLKIRTSISGIVETAARQPLKGMLPSSQVILVDSSTAIRTNAEGVFTIPYQPGLFSSSTLLVSGFPPISDDLLPFTRVNFPLTLEQDNFYARPIYIQPANGKEYKVNRPLPDPASATNAPENMVEAAGSTDPSLEFQPGTIVTGGASGCTAGQPCPPVIFTLTPIESGRLPLDLPVGYYSSSLAQLYPEYYGINPGAKLSLPNTDGLTAGTKVSLFQKGSNFIIFGTIPFSFFTSSQFALAGTATVSQDGQRIETAADQIRTGGQYFASPQYPTTNVVGRVIVAQTGIFSLSSTTSAQRAIVMMRGQTTLTDQNGGFVLSNVPVLRVNDKATVEVTYLRPSGRVERTERQGVALSATTFSKLESPILLPIPVNRPPVLVTATNISAAEGSVTNAPFLANDPDLGQTVQVSVKGPQFVSLVNTAEGIYSLRVAPGYNDEGQYLITLTVVDVDGVGVSQEIRLTVTHTNQAPVAQTQQVNTDEDQPNNITLIATDPDRDALRYSLVTKPAHGTLSGTAPDLKYLPVRDYNGSDSFTFKVSDGIAESAVATVTITINAVPDAPTIVLPDEQKGTAGQALSFDVSAADVDANDSLKLTAENLPSGASFNQTGAATGKFTWAAATAGTYFVTFKATDSTNLTAQRGLTITIGGSANQGQWTRLTNQPGNGNVTKLLPQGNALWATTPTSLFISTDQGQSWTERTAGLPPNPEISSLAVNDATIFVIVYNGTDTLGNYVRGGVFRSSDQGKTWVSLSIANFSFSGGWLATANNKLFAGDFSNILRSEDSGATWQRAQTGLPTDYGYSSLASNGKTLFVFNNRGLIYRSPNNGDLWELSPTELGNQSFGNFAASEKIALTLFYATGYQTTTNEGQSWRPINQASLPRYNYFTPQERFIFHNAVGVVADRIFLHTYESMFAGDSGTTPIFNPTLYLSSDQGQSWFAVNKGLSDLAVNKIVGIGSIFFAATTKGIWQRQF